MQSNHCSISSESPKLERQLGFYERFRVVLHDLGYYNNVSIIARYSYGVDLQRSWPHAIYHAFTHAIQEHPALGMCVTQDEKQNLCFQRLGSINLEEIIKFELAEDPEQVLMTLSSKENNQGFDMVGKPLWRAVVLRNSRNTSDKHFWIGVFWHHVIGDGKSGLAIHESILEGLASFENLDCRTNRPPENDTSRVPVSTKPLFIPMEQALPDSKAPTPIPPISECEKWTGGNFNFRQPTVTKLAHLRLPSHTLERVLEACRRNKTTMTAFLQAVMAKAVLDNVSQDRLRTAVAVSLRRFFATDIAVSDSVMGLWISTYTTEYHRSQFAGATTATSTTLWQRARENTAQINEFITDGGKNVELMSLKGIDDYEGALKPRADKPRDNSFGLTNVGVFKSSQKGGVAIDDMILSQSAHANGAAFTICIVSVQGGDMNMVFNWQEGIISQDLMSAFVDTVRSVLLDVSATS
ncbi:hypothetical protein AA313_de0202957 [Arthrobotrys entomopaga]|nr:hypothetical protein AA313_de0202957 [Arthrobotrys entomopaga]